MRNKTQYIVSRETTEDEMKKIKKECKENDMRIEKEESCDIKYHVKSCRVYPADGHLVQFDGESGRLLVIQSLPHFKNERSKDGKPKIYNKVVAEIRWPGSLFRIMANSIIDEILDYDRLEKKKAPLKEFFKNNENDEIMFR